MTILQPSPNHLHNLRHKRPPGYKELATTVEQQRGDITSTPSHFQHMQTQFPPPPPAPALHVCCIEMSEPASLGRSLRFPEVLKADGLAAEIW